MNKHQKLLKNIALIAAGFSLLICLLIVANYFQLNRVDPVNTELINQLVERLNNNPDDATLRVQIRELDLLARKAYFTNNWQIKTGGYLVLLGLAVFVIAWQLLELNQRKQVMQNPGQPQDILGIQKNARIGIGIIGGALVVVAVGLALFSNPTQQATSDTKLALNDNATKPMVEKDEVSVLGKSGENDVLAIDKVSERLGKETESAVGIEAETKPGGEQEIMNKEKVQPLDKKPVQAQKEETVKVVENAKDVRAEEKIVVAPSVEMLKKNVVGFRGYHGNGVVYAKNIPQKWDGTTGENIKWKVPIPIQGYNSPIVWDDKIFVTGANDNVREVYCFSRIDGALLWKVPVVNIAGSPAKAPKTTADTGLAAPTMATDGNYVYAIFGTGDVLALTMDGKMVWGKNLGVPVNHYGYSSSLLVYNNKLIVQYDEKQHPRIMALDCKTGEEVWSSERQVKISWASPLLVEDNGTAQIITVVDPFVISNDPETGKENWKLNCMYGEVGPSAVYDNGKVFAVNEYARLVAIDLKDPGKIFWESDELLSDVPSPIAANGYVIVPASYGAIGCFNAENGEFVWDAEIYNNVYSSPMLVGENIYLIDTKGNTHIFKLGNAYEEVATCPLGEDVYCTPAFVEGQIIIRTNKHLYCIGE
jgi:outer membrane protein assembly factor BamB